MNIDLDADAPPSPERTLQLAQAFAAVARALARTTMHCEALQHPPGRDRVLRELSSAVACLPQLLSQFGGSLRAEEAAGRVEVTEGEYAGRSDLAASVVNLRLDAASALLEMAYAEMERAASVTSCVAVREDRGDDSR